MAQSVHPLKKTLISCSQESFLAISPASILYFFRNTFMKKNLFIGLLAAIIVSSAAFLGAAPNAMYDKMSKASETPDKETTLDLLEERLDELNLAGDKIIIEQTLSNPALPGKIEAFEDLEYSETPEDDEDEYLLLQEEIGTILSEHPDYDKVQEALGIHEDLIYQVEDVDNTDVDFSNITDQSNAAWNEYVSNTESLISDQMQANIKALIAELDEILPADELAKFQAYESLFVTMKDYKTSVQEKLNALVAYSLKLAGQAEDSISDELFTNLENLSEATARVPLEQSLVSALAQQLRSFQAESALIINAESQDNPELADLIQQTTQVSGDDVASQLQSLEKQIIEAMSDDEEYQTLVQQLTTLSQMLARLQTTEGLILDRLLP